MSEQWLKHRQDIFVDHFSKFTIMVSTHDQTAVITAKLFRTDVAQLYGYPKCIISDQGSNFESQIFSKLCCLRRIHTPPLTTIYSGTRPVSDSVKHSYTWSRPWSKGTRISCHNILEVSCGPIMTQYTNATRYTPFFLMFGQFPYRVEAQPSPDFTVCVAAEFQEKKTLHRNTLQPCVFSPDIDLGIGNVSLF